MVERTKCTRRLGADTVIESAWQQLFTLDPFGNLKKSGTSNFLATYSNSTNRFTVSGVNVQYDGNGNLLTDNLNVVDTWDPNFGNPKTINNTTLIYDALGRVVEQQTGSSYTEILYSPAGKTALMNGQTLVKAFIYLPGGGPAIYNSTGLAYFRHSDWLGSSRLTSTVGRASYSTVAYAPYGEPYPSSAPDISFTGQNPDTISSLYDFLYREQSYSQGRWISPDPAGLGAVDPTNPQRWNRYAYVLNSPLDMVDPLGLDHTEFWGPCRVHFRSYQYSVGEHFYIGIMVDDVWCPDRGHDKPKPDSDPENNTNRSILNCTIATANKLTITNAIAHIPGVGNLIPEGSWARAGLDAVGGGNAVSGLLATGQTLFGNSADGKELAQAGAGILVDPSLGLNPVLKTVSLAGEGAPSIAPDIIEGGASLLGATEEAATGIGLFKLGADALLTAGSAVYCLATHK